MEITIFSRKLTQDATKWQVLSDLDRTTKGPLERGPPPEPNYTELEHLSNWFAGSASWRTAFLLEKCVLHGQTVEQTALVEFLPSLFALSSPHQLEPDSFVALIR